MASALTLLAALAISGLLAATVLVFINLTLVFTN